MRSLDLIILPRCNLTQVTPARVTGSQNICRPETSTVIYSSLLGSARNLGGGGGGGGGGFSVGQRKPQVIH